MAEGGPGGVTSSMQNRSWISRAARCSKTCTSTATSAVSYSDDLFVTSTSMPALRSRRSADRRFPCRTPVFGLGPQHRGGARTLHPTPHERDVCE